MGGGWFALGQGPPHDNLHTPTLSFQVLPRSRRHRACMVRYLVLHRRHRCCGKRPRLTFVFLREGKPKTGQKSGTPVGAIGFVDGAYSWATCTGHVSLAFPTSSSSASVHAMRERYRDQRPRERRRKKRDGIVTTSQGAPSRPLVLPPPIGWFVMEGHL